jgi:hypothetical protein
MDRLCLGVDGIVTDRADLARGGASREAVTKASEGRGPEHRL